MTNSSDGARVADEHLHHEPVDLRLGQRVGALGLDRVLGRQDEERARDLEGLAPDRHLPLLHDLEQRALDLGGRAVDLVGEEEVGEDRAERRPELARLLVVDPRADQVGRDEVGRELDALELAADRLGQRLDRHRLGKARDALDEDVAAGEQRDDQPLQQVVLADDDLLDLVEQALHRGGAVLAGWLIHWHVRSVRRQAGGAAGNVDRHGEADADEDVVLGRIDRAVTIPMTWPSRFSQRPAGVARIDGGVDLERPWSSGPLSASGTSGRAPR